MTTTQPGWYDDPEDASAQRYWDGGDWTPHRQRKPISQSTQPPPPDLPPPPLPPPPPAASSSGAEYPPPPSGAEYPPPGGPPQRSRTPIAVIAVVGVLAVLVVAGVLGYKFVYLPHHSSSASTDSASGAPKDSAPGAPNHSAPSAPKSSAPGTSTGGGEDKFLSDLATVGIDSSTARPEVLVAKGRKACSALAAGESQDAAAADIVSSSNHFFDESSASKIVKMAVQDLCPQ
jgi:Protein of unknown function (DUF732)/Protein of unknown function (DUF2510)